MAALAILYSPALADDRPHFDLVGTLAGDIGLPARGSPTAATASRIALPTGVAAESSAPARRIHFRFFLEGPCSFSEGDGTGASSIGRSFR